MSNSLALITVGLGFGDEGKGTIVDALTRKHSAGLVIRFNGGAQCGHRVVTSTGQEHVFSQFGSGTLAGAKTLLSEHMLVNPPAMVEEESLLQKQGVTDAFDRMYVDENAIVVTPFHIAVNRLREMARGDNRHGSCGHGIGECRQQHIDKPRLTIRMKDLLDPDLANMLFDQQDYLLYMAQAIQRNPGSWSPEEVTEADPLLQGAEFMRLLASAYRNWTSRIHIVSSEDAYDLINDQAAIVFEGAQGVLLDQDYGFHPHTTWSDTTMRNAHDILDKAQAHDERGLPSYAIAMSGRHGFDVTRIGILRTYMTRHGAGPFVTEDADLTRDLPDARNGNNGPQGAFRCGHLDLAALKYALAVNGPVDGLAVTHCDVMFDRELLNICDTYLEAGSGPWSPFYLSGLRAALMEPVTDRLFRSTPDLSPRSFPGLMRSIERELNTPIRIASYGPTAEDKRFHDNRILIPTH